MQEFVERIRIALAAESGLEAADLKIELPRDPSLGDFAFPCFPLARTLKKAPPAIAAELGPKVDAALDGISVEATGPYLNFRIDRAALSQSVVGGILIAGADYGGSDEGAGKTIVIDFSSPNIAKPFHVGHLRSTIIGASIKRMHDALGYRTVGINHIGDWGSQFGKLVAALDLWGQDLNLDEDPIGTLVALYQRYDKESKENPDLVEAGRAAFRELESGVDGPVRQMWRRLTELSLREFERIYTRLGVSFDHIRGEAFYEDFLDQTVERIVATGITEESKGALIVDLETEGEEAPCLLRKSDGTTLYATRDLAAMFHRWNEFEFDRCLYVVGGDQRLHFRQLKGVLRRMETPWEDRIEHVVFGLLRLPEGKLSTRQGRVVLLDDLLDSAVDEAKRVISEKNPDLANADEIAQMVGYGAVVFHDLKKERIKDVLFDWKEVISFEGETGPYVQYTHVRMASILRKATAKGIDIGPGSEASVDWSLLADAGPLLRHLGCFPDVLKSAAKAAEPSLISTYVLQLSREMNSWYVDHRVLSEDEALTSARLALVRAAKIALHNGLTLLGVGAPEEM
ncbi:MAG: arginyl-tRNA synthetase [Planctomycetota bacterium]|jgi:arginyl-tRNA synthetase